jgi:transposase
MNPRKERGIEIAARFKLTQKGETWIVPSQSGNPPYTVDLSSDPPSCTCQDFELHRVKCKHMFAVEITIRREQGTHKRIPVRETTATRKRKTTYKQEWSAYNSAQVNEKSHFQEFLHELCRDIPNLAQTRGRRRLPLSDMMFCAALKVFSTVSTRRIMTDLIEAHAKGYISKVAHFNAVSTYLDMKELTPIIRQLITESSLPLKAVETEFAVDASGFSTCKHVSWFNVRYGHEQDNKDWIKLHLTCGVKTHIVTSCEITGRHANDSPLLPALINDTARNFKIKGVSADKAYSSKNNIKLIVCHGGTPYIPFKTLATGEGGGLWGKAYHYYHLHRDEFMDEYHKRSNVESTFSMIKAKFGGYIRSKTDTAQVNEALMKVLCHNICVMILSMYELGIEPSFAFGTPDRFSPPVENDEDSAQLTLL